MVAYPGINFRYLLVSPRKPLTCFFNFMIGFVNSSTAFSIESSGSTTPFPPHVLGSYTASSQIDTFLVLLQVLLPPTSAVPKMFMMFLPCFTVDDDVIKISGRKVIKSS